MAEKTLEGRAGDFLVHMESPQKCLHYGQITMPASGGNHALTNVTAYPIKANNVLAIAGDEADVVGFIIAGEAFEDQANDAETAVSALYTLLTEFDGCVLNEDAIPANDCQATPSAFTLANIKTASGLSSVKWVSEPDKVTEQLD